MHIRKKGLSPVVATIMLVSIVVVIALIIFLWFRTVVGDYGQKFDENIELVCQDVQLRVNYDAPFLSIINDGNVPVFKINLKIEGPGGYETAELNSIVSDWPSSGLNQGGIYSGDISSKIGSTINKITAIPVLIGISDKGNKKTYSCEEQYGYEIII